jgi:hypothetical protein
MAYASRRLIEAAQSVLAYRRQWTLNEKGIVARAGLADYADLLLQAHDDRSLGAALTEITAHVTRLTVPST